MKFPERMGRIRANEKDVRLAQRFDHIAYFTSFSIKNTVHVTIMIAVTELKYFCFKLMTTLLIIVAIFVSKSLL